MLWMRPDDEGQRRQGSGGHRANHLAASLQDRIRAADARLLELKTVASLVDLSDAERFDAYASAVVASSPRIRVLAWASVVADTDRGNFGAGVGEPVGSSIPVRERPADFAGDAPGRDRRFALGTIHPVGAGETALRLDRTGKEAWSTALAQALRDMRPVATAPLPGVRGEAAASYLVFIPVTHGVSREILLAKLEPALMVGDAVADDPSVAVRIDDVTDDGVQVSVARMGAAGAEGDPLPVVGHVQLAGRTLQLAVGATAAPHAGWSLAEGWLPAAGLLVFAMLTTLTRVLASRNRQIRNLLDERSAFMATPSGVLIVGEGGSIEDANEHALALLERRREDLLGTRVDDLVQPRPGAEADGRAGAELTLSLPGARTPWIDVAASDRPGGADPPTCVMLLRDATSRVLARREADQLRSLLHAAGQPLAFINADREVEVANPAFARAFGCPPQAPAGRTLADVLGPSFGSELEQALLRVFGGRIQHLPVDVGVDGARRTLELELAPLWCGEDVSGVVVSGHDITDRAAAQRALESYRDTLEREVRERTDALDRTRARLAHTLESSPVPTFVVNREGLVSHWNKACAVAFGIAPEEMVGTSEVWRAFYDEPQPLMTELIVSGRIDELHRRYGPACWPSSLVDGAFEAEAHFAKLDRWLFLTAAPMVDGEGNCIGAIETMQDVTTRKEAEQMMARAREAAEAAARAKSEFLANMSHEIRTPLNGVIGLAQVGVRENAGRRAHHTFERIRQSASHLLGLINDLLDFSKIESGRFELDSAPFELPGVVDQALAIATPGAFERAIAVRVSESPNLPRQLRGDGLRLTQCLVNLLGNAIKFTAAGSVRLDVHHDGSTLSLTVTDTGIGMNREQMSRLFRPFEQADGSTTRRFGGTGLGLAITHQLVTMMGGTLTVDSETGRGSRFELRVRLPVVAAAGAPAPGLPAQLMQTGLDDGEAAWLAHELSRHGCRLRSMAPSAAARDSGTYLLGPADALALAAEAGAPESRFIVIHDPGPAPRLGRIHWPRPLLVRRLASLLAGGLPETPVVMQRRLAGLQVLGVDDNEVNRLVLQDLLRLEGVSLRLASGGEEALALVLAHPPGAFDIALLDIEMPGMDGYALARELKKLRPALPLVGLTAHASRSDRNKCLGAGMDEHLAKPYELDRLVEIICKLANTPDKEIPMAPEFPNVRAPALDHERSDHVDIDALLKRFRGRNEFVMRLLRTAAEANQSASTKIADAAQRRDFESLRQLAHTVKGMSGNLCATALQQRAAEVERMARAQQVEVFAEADQLAGAVDSLVASIRRLLVD